jgi:hypothetical protein
MSLNTTFDFTIILDGQFYTLFIIIVTSYDSKQDSGPPNTKREA